MRAFWILIGVLSFFSAGVDVQAAQAVQQPNVVLIFIDDMGFGDVGFNGATGPKTPNLDQMAREGMQFRDFYVGCAVCSGSRTALMTGTHYRRLNMAPVLFPNSNEGLHPDEVTIADMLLDAGYSTKCIGKWHLGHLPPCLPTYQGFQSYYGIPYSNDMWIDPANKLADDIVLREDVTLEQLQEGQTLKDRVPLMRDEEVIEYPVDQKTVTKRYTEEAVRFIQDNQEGPFFLYLPHTMVHRPLAVSKEFENRTGKLIWDAIEEVDWSVGKILTALKEAGIEEKTLVIFTSDNGAAVGSSLPLRGRKASVYDGGIREPTVMWWPSKIPAGEICNEVTASIDVLPTLAGLCHAKLPDRKIDGHDIWPLMSGQVGAVSPHKYYCLTHRRGAVRSGKWKYYPWPEGQEAGPQEGELPDGTPEVQLYDTVADIGETRNLAEQYPEVVEELQSAWEAHNQELEANLRPTAVMARPESAPAPNRPGTNVKPLDWSAVEQGQVYSSRAVSNLVKRPFTLTCQASGENLQGVLVAQGGTVTGYSLYMNAGQLVFAVRRSDTEIHRVTTALEAAEDYKITAMAKKDGLSLTVNQQEVAELECPGWLLRHPGEGLAIGFDNQMPVDPEAPGDAFNGKVEQVGLKVGK